jgi:rhodanese-related sulfurtransferase
MKKGPILTIIVVVILMYLIYMAIPANYNQPSLRIGIPEARSRRFGLIIDVRTPKERDQLGYYPNSIPISLERLRSEVPLDISNKNTWILVYCNTGRRAEMAAEILYKMGYPNVRYINESYLSLMPGSSY